MRRTYRCSWQIRHTDVPSNPLLKENRSSDKTFNADGPNNTMQ